MLRGAHLAIGCPVLSKDRFPLASSKAQPAHSVHAPRAHALHRAVSRLDVLKLPSGSHASY